jgi:hypothetical protein
MEREVIRLRLENLLKCSVTSDQIDIFIKEAGALNMNPLEAIEFLEGLELSKEEIKKILRGL